MPAGGRYARIQLCIATKATCQQGADAHVCSFVLLRKLNARRGQTSTHAALCCYASYTTERGRQARMQLCIATQATCKQGADAHAYSCVLLCKLHARMRADKLACSFVLLRRLHARLGQTSTHAGSYCYASYMSAGGRQACMQLCIATQATCQQSAATHACSFVLLHKLHARSGQTSTHAALY